MDYKSLRIWTGKTTESYHNDKLDITQDIAVHCSVLELESPHIFYESFTQNRYKLNNVSLNTGVILHITDIMQISYYKIRKRNLNMQTLYLYTRIRNFHFLVFLGQRGRRDGREEQQITIMPICT